MDREEAEELFLERLSWIEAMIRKTAQRRGVGLDEIEELRSRVFLHLIEDDYRVIREYRGKSRLSTYLATVIQRLFIDYCYRRHGRWRPSTAARRLGAVAVRLEVLCHRDGFSFAEARQILLDEEGHRICGADIDVLWRQLPCRPPSRRLSDQRLDQLPAPGRADRALRFGEQRCVLRQLLTHLQAALAELAADDRLLLRLRFFEGMTVRAIGQLLRQEPRPLYRQCQRALRGLRCSLEEQGLSWTEIHQVLSTPELLIDLEGELPWPAVPSELPQRTRKVS